MKESKLQQPGEYKSPLSVSSKCQDIISRNSVMSNISSINDETMMTDIADFFNNSKIEIYQTVDDLIRIVEAQEFIKTNKSVFQQNKYVTPKRQTRKGIDLTDTVSIKINPLSASSNPFSQYDSEDDHELMTNSIQSISPFEFESNIREILFPDASSILSNIDEGLISKIHSACKSQLNDSILSLCPKIPQASSISIIQRLNTLKKSHMAAKYGTQSL